MKIQYFQREIYATIGILSGIAPHHNIWGIQGTVPQDVDVSKLEVALKQVSAVKFGGLDQSVWPQSGFSWHSNSHEGTG